MSEGRIRPSSARPNPRRAGLRLLLATAFIATGCWQDGPSTTQSFIFEGSTYFTRAPARIPEADLTPIGRAEQLSSDHVTDPTVLSIRDVDPAGTVAVYLDRSAGVGAPEDNLNVELFVTEAQSDLPQAVCRYFAPLDASTPFVCQSRVSVGFGGRRYVPVESFTDPQSQVCGNDFFLFLSSDLQPLVAVDDLDPRLLWSDPDPVAWAVKGVPPETLIMLVSGEGFGQSFCVLAPEETSGVPFELCQYYNLARSLGSQQPERLHDSGEPIPEGCLLHADEPLAGHLEVLTDRANQWSIRNVSDYRYTVALSCFCPAGLKGPFTVRVTNGSDIVDVRRADTTLEPGDRALKWVGELRTLFTYVRSYLRSASFEVRYDPTYGFPVEMRADPSLDVIDDEFGFEVLDFTVLETRE
jgi:hypothetical protein